MGRVVRLTEARVRELLPVEKSIRVAREAYLQLARKEAAGPERVWLTTPQGMSLFCMPCYVLGEPTVMTKIARLNPANPRRDLPSVQATIYVYDSTTGRELATIEADALTALRTAASSAVATDLLAEKNAETLGVIGTGTQAYAHIPAIDKVRNLSRVLVYSRNRRRRERFARRASRANRIRVLSSKSAEQVVEESNVIVLATNSTAPLFKGKLVRPSTHVNAIGAALPNARETDTELVKRSFLVVDSLAQAKSSYGDIIIPLREKAISLADVHELGSLLLHPKRVEKKAERISLFKSGGLAVLDAVVANYLVSRLPRL